MLMHLYFGCAAAAFILTLCGILKDNKYASILAGVTWFIVAMGTPAIEFIWITDVGTVITYTWDDETMFIFIFGALGVFMFVVGILQTLGYAQSEFEKVG